MRDRLIWFQWPVSQIAVYPLLAHSLAPAANCSTLELPAGPWLYGCTYPGVPPLSCVFDSQLPTNLLIPFLVFRFLGLSIHHPFIFLKSAYPASKILEDNASMDFWYAMLKDMPYEIAENAALSAVGFSLWHKRLHPRFFTTDNVSSSIVSKASCGWERAKMIEETKRRILGG